MRHASLFSGIGGPEIAAAMMGWSNVFHCEINPFGRHIKEDGQPFRLSPLFTPVHRGNDGLPFSLDDLTIPATRWRTESLKAYGNAIVPQVMYRIFQAIEVAS